MKKAGSKWTQDEIEILKKYYWDLGPLGLTKMIPNHPHCSIVAKGRKLGLNSKDGVLWTDEEIEIMKKYYPTEGTKVYKRLQNRSKENIKSKARHLGIKYDQTIVEWDQTEDEIIYEFFKTHEKKSFNKIPELIQELCDNGFTGHGTKSVYMRLHNICYLETGYGFSHASKQSKVVHINNNKKVTI